MFALGLWLVALALDALLMWGIHRKQTGDYGVWNRIVSGRINTELLISGSSRALMDVDSRRLGQATGLTCFNIAIDGARLEAQAALLETYLHHNRAPAVIIQTVDIFSLEPLDQVYQPSLYAPYLNETSLYAYTRAVEPGFWMRRHVPLYNFAVDKVMLFESIWSLIGRETASWEYRFDGYRPHNGTWDGSFDRFIDDHPGGKTYPITQAGINHLQHIAGLAKEYGAQLIVVYPPEFHRNIELTINRAEIFQAYMTLATQNHVPFWDFSDDPICRDHSAFYNSQHLNRDGAERFTDLLAQHLLVWKASSQPNLYHGPGK
ncbi:MAG: hypothetical protein WCS52_12845 [bacterium]